MLSLTGMIGSSDMVKIGNGVAFDVVVIVADIRKSWVCIVHYVMFPCCIILAKDDDLYFFHRLMALYQ